MTVPESSRSAGYITVAAALAVTLVAVLAIVAGGHNRSVGSLFAGGAWVRSLVTRTLQHVNGPSGAVDSSPKREGFPTGDSVPASHVGDRGVVRDPAPGKAGP